MFSTKSSLFFNFLEEKNFLYLSINILLRYNRHVVMYIKIIKLIIKDIITMKKTFLIMLNLALAIGFVNCNTFAATQNIIPKAPYVSQSMKPVIAKYRQQNFVGSLQDLTKILDKEPENTLAKYYAALTYTQLGRQSEAENMYKEVVNKNDNEILVHYSQKALDCLRNPESEACKPKKVETTTQEVDEITRFIQSGKQIHPAAMDRITRERMERKLQESEYQRKQQEQNNLKSDASMPTNEEIASALNTLSKIGLNPYAQPQAYLNPMMQAGQFNQFGYLPSSNNMNLYGALLGNNSSPDIAKMFLYNQMTNQQNSLINYGI